MNVQKLSDGSIYAECGCGCRCGDAIEFSVQSDMSHVSFSTKIPGSRLKSKSSIANFINRIKVAFHILIGREYTYHEIIMTIDDFNALTDMVVGMDHAIIKYLLRRNGGMRRA